MVEQSWWNSHSGTVMVEWSWWNSLGGTVMVEQSWWNSHGGTVMVEQSWWNSHSLTSTGFVLNTNVATLSLFCNTNTAAMMSCENAV